MTAGALVELADRFGTPLYVYSLDHVRAAHRRLRAALPGDLLYYSLKANPHPRLVSELARLGCGAEISSPGELRTAIAAGVDAGRCLYTGPGKTPAEIDLAVRTGVRSFSVESLVDLDRVEAAASAHDRRVEALVRLNPDENVGGHGLAMTGAPSQFGMDHRAVVAALPRLSAPGCVRVAGFHCYFGTNLLDPAALLDQFRLAARLSAELARELGLDLRLVDLGGGFGHPFCVEGETIPLDGVREELEDILDRQLAGWRRGRPAIAFESGRFLVAGSGNLLCRVQDVKTSMGETFAVVDAGIHHLGGMSGLRRLPRLQAAALHARPSMDPAPAVSKVNLVGPLCTPVDSLSRGLEVAGLAIGDVLRVPNVGAYGLTASLIAFLGRDCPLEVVVDGQAVDHVSSLVITRDSSPFEGGGAWNPSTGSSSRSSRGA